MDATDLLLFDDDTPPEVSLEELAQIRGAMWTARMPVPWGPRPYADDNCCCIDYFECFSPAHQDRIIAAYGPASPRRYRTSVMGPLVDPGYHGQLPSTDWRGDPTVYFDGAEKLERAGIHVDHFLRPDRGVVGLEWTVDDLDRELGPIFRSNRAQKLMRIVTIGWEPGPRYYYPNRWWVEMARWQAETFPKALRLIHMVADCDAPAGQDDDVRGITNADAWANVAPYLHGWLVQVAGYVFGPGPTPTPEFVSEFQKIFAARRFAPGNPYGWPTSSAWGPTRGLKVYAGEYAAFGDYWFNWPESVSQQLGDLAMAAGADGYLDGGTR